jgi:hypothetical protein
VASVNPQHSFSATHSNEAFSQSVSELGMPSAEPAKDAKKLAPVFAHESLAITFFSFFQREEIGDIFQKNQKVIQKASLFHPPSWKKK